MTICFINNLKSKCQQHSKKLHMDAMYQNGWKIIGVNIHVENIMQVENLEKVI